MKSRQESGGDPRVALAIERTFLAWVRTGLAMMGFGLVVARLGIFLREIELVRSVATFPGRGVSLIMGTSLIALGVLVNLYAAVHYHRDLSNLEAGRNPPRNRVVPTAVAAALALIGIATVWYFVRFG